MGEFYVSMQVGNILGGDMWLVQSALVDTGAAHTTLPASLLERLRVEPIIQKGFELANRKEVTYPCGQARIRLQGQDVDLFCMVIFGPEDQYIVGATTLENFGVLVDPKERRLVPRVHRARPF